MYVSDQEMFSNAVRLMIAVTALVIPAAAALLQVTVLCLEVSASYEKYRPRVENLFVLIVTIAASISSS